MNAAPNIVPLPGAVALSQAGVSRCAVARLWLIAKALREERVPGPGPHGSSRVNACTLATALEVCPKTISRDLQFLRELGHNITYDAGSAHWSYRTLPSLTYL